MKAVKFMKIKNARNRPCCLFIILAFIISASACGKAGLQGNTVAASADREWIPDGDLYRAGNLPADDGDPLDVAGASAKDGLDQGAENQTPTISFGGSYYHAEKPVSKRIYGCGYKADSTSMAGWYGFEAVSTGRTVKFTTYKVFKTDKARSGSVSCYRATDTYPYSTDNKQIAIQRIGYALNCN